MFRSIKSGPTVSRGSPSRLVYSPSRHIPRSRLQSSSSRPQPNNFTQSTRYPTHTAHKGLGLARNFTSGPASAKAIFYQNVPLGMRALADQSDEERRKWRGRGKYSGAHRVDSMGGSRRDSRKDNSRSVLKENRQEFSKYFGFITAENIEEEARKPIILIVRLQPNYSTLFDDSSNAADTTPADPSSWHLLPDVTSSQSPLAVFQAHTSRVQDLYSLLDSYNIFTDRSVTVNYTYTLQGEKATVQIAFGGDWKMRDLRDILMEDEVGEEMDWADWGLLGVRGNDIFEIVDPEDGEDVYEEGFSTCPSSPLSRPLSFEDDTFGSSSSTISFDQSLEDIQHNLTSSLFYLPRPSDSAASVFTSDRSSGSSPDLSTLYEWNDSHRDDSGSHGSRDWDTLGSEWNFGESDPWEYSSMRSSPLPARFVSSLTSVDPSFDLPSTSIQVPVEDDFDFTWPSDTPSLSPVLHTPTTTYNDTIWSSILSSTQKRSQASKEYEKGLRDFLVGIDEEREGLGLRCDAI